MPAESRLTRIGVFYDGNYFLHVSNYYNYSHERRSRISISGLHAFIRRQVAEEEGVNERLCQIVDAHYFRGRLNAHEANQRGNQLFYDRLFDDILMSEGVVTHYLPVKTYQGYRQEKGIDVWLALEAFELAQYKKFDVVVLITSDGDYVPLIRKLNTLGSRIMVLSWDFEFLNEQGEKQVTRTSQDLLEEVSYPVAMHGIIDDRSRRNDMVIQNLFVKQAARPTFSTVNGNGNSYTNGMSYGSSLSLESNYDYDSSIEPNYNVADSDPEGRKISTIRSLKTGYGFVNYPPNNLFFHYTSLVDTDFNELQVDDEVEFSIGQNAEGKDIAVDVRLLRQ
ncbi:MULTISPECIES: NYN domain-containing protein [unclassified Spirosoma]|uniref:NYN domain-containing protein n=1 Tax=unclassified Spirosoma TaxID=2621999 RepID=UPI00095B7169|nr:MULTISPECIES: NYN domain-containing protein [unclassified Spirosoma]MBN8823548.1 NYN domain-containing protein [Spirosoma sp.]OJW71847.1 MAG: cold-shock protein [Spirosoma sp. 48-14]